MGVQGSPQVAIDSRPSVFVVMVRWIMFGCTPEYFLLELFQLSYKSWVGVDLHHMFGTLVRFRRIKECACA